MSNYKLYTLDKTIWENHWTNGGTGITRACGPEIAESVKLFGSLQIWMEDENRELHSTIRDLSAFWAFHRNRTNP